MRLFDLFKGKSDKEVADSNIKKAEFTGEDEKIFEGLKLYSIVYDYNKKIAAHSPTGEDGFFGEFEFSFEAGNDFVKKILQAASIKIAVSNGKIVGAKCSDI